MVAPAHRVRHTGFTHRCCGAERKKQTMSVGVTTEVVGVRDAIRSLNKIEPGLRKKFLSDAKEIAEPAITHVQESYVRVPLSGMARNWSQGGSKKFPFDLGRAKRGVKLKVDASREATSIINIQQTDAGAAIFETAGRRTANPLGTALGALQANHTRILGPAVFRRRRQIEDAMRRLAMDAVRKVNEELR